MIGKQEVEAPSLEVAIEIASKLPVPENGEFLEETLQVDPEFVSCM